MIQTLYQHKGNDYSKNRKSARNLMQDSSLCQLLGFIKSTTDTAQGLHEYAPILWGIYSWTYSTFTSSRGGKVNKGNKKMRSTKVQGLRNKSLVGEGYWNQCLLHNHCDNADNTLPLFFSPLLSWWFIRGITRRARIETPSIFISTLKNTREVKPTLIKSKYLPPPS